jgi:hypothetical protein
VLDTEIFRGHYEISLMQQRPRLRWPLATAATGGTKQENPRLTLRGLGEGFSHVEQIPAISVFQFSGRREGRFISKGFEPMIGDKGTSAGARHGSRDTDKTDRDPASATGLNERTGEFRVGEKIVFGMRNGNILLRHSPQGDEVEVAEATLAGLMIDAFFSDKFGEDYPVVK